MKFVIITPRQIWGGAIVLHNLCRLLADQGHDARVYYGWVPNAYERPSAITALKGVLRKAKRFICDSTKCCLVKVMGENRAASHAWLRGYADVSVSGCKRKWLPFVDGDTIVVYPDVAFGNSLGAKHVVRWLLYYNRFEGKESIAYGKDDLFFAYRSAFNDSNLNPECRLLCTPYFNLSLYKQTNYGKRHGICYVVRKGKGRADLPSSFDGVVIDNLPEKEKVRVFNECEICISYDTQTAYSSIASICGCVSFVVMEPGKSKANYINDEEPAYGVAYGFEEKEIMRAIATRDDLIRQYIMLNEQSEENARYFVEECRTFFFGGDE